MTYRDNTDEQLAEIDRKMEALAPHLRVLQRDQQERRSKKWRLSAWSLTWAAGVAGSLAALDAITIPVGRGVVGVFIIGTAIALGLLFGGVALGVEWRRAFAAAPLRDHEEALAAEHAALVEKRNALGATRVRVAEDEPEGHEVELESSTQKRQHGE